MIFPPERKKERLHAAPNQQTETRAGPLPASFHSVLLPERFGGRSHAPPCTFGTRFRASPEPHPSPVPLPERVTPSAGLRLFPGISCAVIQFGITLTRPGPVVNRAFSQNVRKPGTNIFWRRTKTRGERCAFPPENGLLRAPLRRPPRLWPGFPAGDAPRPGPCGAAG